MKKQDPHTVRHRRVDALALRLQREAAIMEALADGYKVFVDAEGSTDVLLVARDGTVRHSTIEEVWLDDEILFSFGHDAARQS